MHTKEYALPSNIITYYCMSLFILIQLADNGLPLDPDVLEKDVVSKMADNWYQFGKHLGLSLETLQSLGDSNYISDNSTRCLVVFRHWVKGAGPIESKTVRDKIEQAMRKVVKVKICIHLVYTTSYCFHDNPMFIMPIFKRAYIVHSSYVYNII